MNIADRIQNLRKLRGISQEQLADRLGVSRQTISKWESEQSAPDMEKIILLSDYFEVTTDYLLKGIEKQEEGSPKPDARIFSLTGTTLGFLGIVISVAIWMERKTVAAVAIGLILTAMSVMIHQIGQIVGGSNAAQARRQYWLLAPWYLAKSFSLCHEDKLTEELFSRDIVDRLKTGFEFLLPYYDYFAALDGDPDPRGQ